MGPGGVLVIIGGTLQVIGPVTTIVGAVKTWNEFSPHERLLDPTRSKVRRLGQRVRAFARRLVRRRHVTVKDLSGAVTASGGLVGTARVRKQFRVLPDDLATTNALAELDERTREMMTRLHDVAELLEDRHVAADRKLGALSDRMEERARGLEQVDRHVATGGIKLAIWGLALSALGAAAMTIGAFLPLY